MFKTEGMITTGQCDICGEKLNQNELFFYPYGNDNAAMKVSVNISVTLSGKERSVIKEGICCSKCYNTLLGWIRWKNDSTESAVPPKVSTKEAVEGMERLADSVMKVCEGRK